MESHVRKPAVTHQLYLGKLQSETDAYKAAHENVEDIFSKSEALPAAPHLPMSLFVSADHNLKKKKELYQWDHSDRYPPHIKIVSSEDQANLFEIFSTLRLIQVADLEGDVKQFFGCEGDESKLTMESIEQRYKKLSGQEGFFSDIYYAPNIGVRPNGDWYTDAVFAQQAFTGVNPISIRKVTTSKHDWLAEFRQAASDQKNEASISLLSTTPPDNFFIVDNSDYREIVGVASDAQIFSGVNDSVDPSNPLNTATGAPPAYGAASVTLYTLDDTGILHPVAICLDYVGPLGANGTIPSKSITIFNKRTTPTSSGVDEYTDWPWRFAKMTASMSDWSRHEITSHLTETHLVEEAIIIAMQRNLPDDHIVFQLLQPHWYKTLSLNVMARSTLVPDYIKSIAPLPLDGVLEFIKQTYLKFDFVGRYTPNDLPSRGFPIDELKAHADKHGGKFHNYLYARGVAETWEVLRGFVSDVLTSAYPDGDAAVKADTRIADFCTEMRQGADMYSAASIPPPEKKATWWDTIKHDAEVVVHAVEKGVDTIVHALEGSTHTNLHMPFGPGPAKAELGGALALFPSPQTLNELIDMVTMCIHIAVPQHNAVNYLQQYYLSFLPNRPASFATALPSTLEKLQGFTEDDVVASLPLQTDSYRRQWMTMSQVPYLLSAEVDPQSSMAQYVKDVQNSQNKYIKAAAPKFADAVNTLDGLLQVYNGQMDDKTTPYNVLDPEELALSILI